MAKNEREILREWTTIVSEIYGRVEPTLDTYADTDDVLGLGGTQRNPVTNIDIGPGGTGRGRSQSGGGGTTGKGNKERITVQQARAERDARLAAEKGKTDASTNKPATVKTDAERIAAARTDKKIKDIELGIPTTALGKTAKYLLDNPPARNIAGATFGTGVLGVGGAAALALDRQPGEDLTDVAGRWAGKLGQGAGKVVSNAVIQTGRSASDEIDKAAEKHGYTPDSSVINPEFDKAVQDLSKPDGRLGPVPDGSKGLDETRIFTRHPVSGQIVQLNVDNISRVVNQTFYESYECGAGDSAQWQCQIWSSTPVSKLLKGRS